MRARWPPSMAHAGRTTQSSAWHEVKAKVETGASDTAGSCADDALSRRAERDRRWHRNPDPAEQQRRRRQRGGDEIPVHGVGRDQPPMPTSYGKADANAMDVSSVLHRFPWCTARPDIAAVRTGPALAGHSSGPARTAVRVSHRPPTRRRPGGRCGRAVRGPLRAARSGADSSTSTSSYVAPS